MPAERKGSLYILAVCIAAGLTYLLLIPFVGPDRAMGALGILGLIGFQPLFFRKPAGEETVIMDERDRSIARRAASVAGGLTFLSFVLVCMALWFIYQAQGRDQITIHALPTIVAIGTVTLWVSRSLVILFLYRDSSTHE